jgi:hypothetical protein
MDDWNRTRQSLRMNCPGCAVDYVAVDSQAYDSGLRYTTAKWVLKSKYKESKKLSAEAERLKRQADTLAEERYIERWLHLFSSKTKKSIWELLTDSGKHYPALGTFYKHIRDEGLDRYLKRQFRQDISKALSMIGVTDIEISCSSCDVS